MRVRTQTGSQTGCCAIRAKAPVRVPTNPSLKAGVIRCVVAGRLTPALRLGLVTVLSELGFSPDSACTEPVEAPDLQSVGQVETTRRVGSTSCSDYLLSIPEHCLQRVSLKNVILSK